MLSRGSNASKEKAAAVESKEKEFVAPKKKMAVSDADMDIIQ